MKHRYLKYPKHKKYKVLQSKIRYAYKTEDLDANARLINRNIINTILIKKNNVTVFHYVNPCILIPSFNMFIDIMKKLDEKSKKLNGWKSAHLTIKNAREMLEAIRNKFKNETTTKKWIFRNEHSIYELLNIKSSTAPQKLKEIFFGIWIACSKYDTENKLIMLRDVIEGLCKSQMMYHIAEYKSRKDRKYALPWEVVENPLNDWKKFNSSDRIQKRINYYKSQRTKYIMNQNTNKNRDINSFFQKTNKNMSGKDNKNITSVAESIQSNNSKINFHSTLKTDDVHKEIAVDHNDFSNNIPSIHITRTKYKLKSQKYHSRFNERKSMAELRKMKANYLKNILSGHKIRYVTNNERESTQELLDELEEMSEEDF